MGQPNFLIGRGQMLTAVIDTPRKDYPPKAMPYSFAEAKASLLPEFLAASHELDELPDTACPDNFGVISMVLHPAFIAKSYFPTDFFRAVQLIPIGSRSTNVTPRRTHLKKPTGKPVQTTEIFVAGQRSVLRNIKNQLETFAEDSKEAKQLSFFEKVSKFTSETKIQLETGPENYYEVAIHLLPGENSTFLQSAFKNYAATLGYKVFDELSFPVGNLWFVPVCGTKHALDSLGQFAFIRLIRNIPKLRSFKPTTRSGGISLSCKLPTAEPLLRLPKVALLDGGLPEGHSLDRWVHSYRKMDEQAEDADYGPEHGLSVTSAFLFGPITPGAEASRPYSFVDHLRVLDNTSDEEDPLELYRTLGFIEETLLAGQYEFINLSLGPDLPVEDKDIHAWTAVIDNLLRDGRVLMTVAAGNNGEMDQPSGNARIQVPADCVNVLSVGAATSMSADWDRSSYSALGPGRRPGVIKPDVLAFGGSSQQYFHTLAPGKGPVVAPSLGTSFAAPYALRNAVGIRAILGEELSPLAIKALLIHCAKRSKEQTATAVGWGKLPDDIMDIITCQDGVARIVYQGTLQPGKFLRALLPIPAGGLQGKCKLKATFCYACPVDPQDSCAYTRAALEITFRPDQMKKAETEQNAKSGWFFKNAAYATEQDLRKGTSKWENVLHAERNLQGRTLNSPVFDIHYIAREGGADTRRGERLPYALILSIESPNNPTLFTDILQTYTDLSHIQPQISMPITV